MHYGSASNDDGHHLEVAYDGVVTHTTPFGYVFTYACECECDEYPGGDGNDGNDGNDDNDQGPNDNGDDDPPLIDGAPCVFDGMSYTHGTSRLNELNERCECYNGTWTNCCRRRKEYTTVMTDAERQSYNDAILSVSNASSQYYSQFESLIDRHRAVFSSGVHDADVFLPWHRHYILEFEDLLRQVDSTITVPFWDWSLSAANPFASPMFGNQPHWMGGTGDSSDNWCLNSGPFAYNGGAGYKKVDGDCVQRNFNSLFAVGGLLDIQSVLNIPANDFDGFRDQLEHGAGMHDSVHCAVHGTMCTSHASNDPLFFLHHAHIDKIWSDWQEMSSAHLQSYPSSTSTTMLQTGGATVAQFLNTKSQSEHEVCVEYVTSTDSAVFADILSLVPEGQLDTLARVEVPYTDENWFVEQGMDEEQLEEMVYLQDQSRAGVPQLSRSEFYTQSASAVDNVLGVQIEATTTAYLPAYQQTLKAKAISAQTSLAERYANSYGGDPAALAKSSDLKVQQSYEQASVFDLTRLTTVATSASYDRSEDNPEFGSSPALIGSVYELAETLVSKTKQTFEDAFTKHKVPVKLGQEGDACGETMIGMLPGCDEGLSCECVGACADPFIADAPRTCVAEDVPGVANPCNNKACGDTCIMEGDMAGMCNNDGVCSFDYGNLGCGIVA
jgi:tyrosinase